MYTNPHNPASHSPYNPVCIPEPLPDLSDAPKRLGWKQRYMLTFCRKYPGLHTIDPSMVKTAFSLAHYGLLYIVNCGMSTATGRTVYMVSAKR